LDNASSSEATNAEKIGPGCVALVVGPSGAGKDALLRGVQQSPTCDPRLHFAERIVSRPSHAAEAHASGSPEEMNRAAARGDYALAWQAHGLTYGIPAMIDDHVRAGSAVIFNASRTVIEHAHNRYANVQVILVNAPVEVRTQRLLERGRESQSEIEKRLNRSVASFDTSAADTVIDNSGALEDGVAQLSKVLGELLEKIVRV
jgi:ribose 1,5-bisphosphokinase